jgi:hypothetical protein
MNFNGCNSDNNNEFKKYYTYITFHFSATGPLHAFH